MLECYFCGKKIESTEAAVAANWISSFIDYEDAAEHEHDGFEVNEPVCCECQEEKLTFDPDLDEWHFGEY